MGYNHVRMEEHLLPVLQDKFQTIQLEIHQAYGGLWTYFVYVGKKAG
jgi:S-adenosylmethionine-diacylgycerolhomoserine-N-methlytransferase